MPMPPSSRRRRALDPRRPGRRRRSPATRVATALAALAVSAAALAPGPPVGAQSPVVGDLTDRFRAADTNTDGNVDREEFHRRTVEVFYFLDKQRKGYLLISEIDNITPERFRAADANGDGRLSLEEFINARFKD